MKGAATIGAIAGLVLLASSAAHAFLGWPALQSELAAAGVDAAISGALAIGWYFGSVSMFVFACIVLGDTAKVARGRPLSTSHLWFIAAGYLVFGLTAWLMRDMNPHFLLFVVTGLLVAGFAALIRGRGDTGIERREGTP